MPNPSRSIDTLKQETDRRDRTTNAMERKVQREVMTSTSFSEIESFLSGSHGTGEFWPKDNFELSIDWFGLLQQHVFTGDSGVRYYFTAEDGHPSVILPLRLSTDGWIRKIESLGNYYTSLYAPLLPSNSRRPELIPLLSEATRDHHSAHVMRFAPMDPESLVYKTLREDIRAIGWIPFPFFCFGNWYLRAQDNWEEFLKSRVANLRSTIKRMNRKFSAEGGHLEVVTTSEGVEQGIAAFQEVYSASWKVPEPYPDFIPSLIRHLARNGMLRLGIARLQGRPIAAQLWIVGQNKASIYKVAYHEAFSAYSPGTVLTGHLMQHVIELDRVKEVDFLTGDDKYKKIWMSDRRERWGIIAYNPRTVIGLALFIREASGRMAKHLITILKHIFQETRQRVSPPKKPSSR